MIGSGRYILDESGQPLRCEDLLAWAWWMERHDRKVAATEISDEISVSTVFLGLDHRWGDGPPLLWETMIFGGPHDQYQARYESREEAEHGHALAVALASAALEVK